MRPRWGTKKSMKQDNNNNKKKDPEFTEAFLLTYRSFTTPHELLELIIKKYPFCCDAHFIIFHLYCFII